METAKQFSLVLFGATGDLAHRKLFPSLFRLWRAGLIDDFLILATGRSQPDRQAFLAYLRENVEAASKQAGAWAEFEGFVEYFRLDAKNENAFSDLVKTIEGHESKRDLPGSRLFYLSVAPSLFATITENLGESGLLERRDNSNGSRWARLVVEKPFGHDLESARKLDKHLARFVDEDQVYRIDHYLGKETVQNLVAFRFANGMIEPLWNSHHIASVQITVSETLGVGDRAGYYDSAGALRDMMQNHMMQLLALTAMEPPLSLMPNDVRNEKVRVIRSIRAPKSPEEVAASTVRGQYGAGVIHGKPVPGYREEPDVASGSTTSTYVATRIRLDTWRWTGVPFYLRHGKRLPARVSEIRVRFRTPPMHLFHAMSCEPSCPNMLRIMIQPDEGIRLSVGAKRPGPGVNIDSVDLEFTYAEAFGADLPDAYERLLLDAIQGDPTLFIRQDEVEAAWVWADAVLNGFDALPAPTYPNYAAGSSGPADAARIFVPLSGSRASEPPDAWGMFNGDPGGDADGDDT
ncbi:MAG: glucose-6-phosphate dehydrogenase [Phycisphaerales bacterium]